LINYTLSHKNEIKIDHADKSIDSFTILTIFKQAEQNDREHSNQPQVVRVSVAIFSILD
jgi:hypothetical protein